ncbi:Gfo/Idh/MocA family protein [Jiangella muralis]|uniref:Gfo/Idh/MocA family protein n=1 Tax=Jiangella muralis TaxID=702383 RepID=UPI001969C5B4|nr:Gfo/Idh/MocA family oxidoreductase [Jiangella muralis]
MSGPDPGPAGIAVLGSGGIARAHVAALSRVPGVRVTHVLGSDPARAAEVAALAPGCRPATSLDDVLADPGTHGVYVCGRTEDHPGRTLAAVAAGKHVVVEKPPARDVADFDAMVRAAKSAGVRLMVGQTVRFQPAVATLEAASRSGRVGDPRLLHLNWYVGHVWPGAWRSWQLDPRQSGGHLVHNGMHPLDLAIWLLRARPVRVFTRGWCTHAPDMPTPDSFHLTVRFADGGLAMIEVSYGLRDPGDVLRRMVLCGTEGTLGHHTSDDAAPSDGGPPVPLASVGDAVQRQAEHAAAVVSGRAEPLIELRHSRWALAAAIAAQRSLDTGRPVDVPDGPDGGGVGDE